MKIYAYYIPSVLNRSGTSRKFTTRWQILSKNILKIQEKLFTKFQENISTFSRTFSDFLFHLWNAIGHKWPRKKISTHGPQHTNALLWTTTATLPLAGMAAASRAQGGGSRNGGHRAIPHLGRGWGSHAVQRVGCRGRGGEKRNKNIFNININWIAFKHNPRERAQNIVKYCWVGGGRWPVFPQPTKKDRELGLSQRNNWDRKIVSKNLLPSCWPWRCSTKQGPGQKLHESQVGLNSRWEGRHPLCVLHHKGGGAVSQTGQEATCIMEGVQSNRGGGRNVGMMRCARNSDCLLGIEHSAACLVARKMHR